MFRIDLGLTVLMPRADCVLDVPPFLGELGLTALIFRADRVLTVLRFLGEFGRFVPCSLVPSFLPSFLPSLIPSFLHAFHLPLFILSLFRVTTLQQR